MFSADAAQKGLSLLADKEGETIAAPCVTLWDDPFHAVNPRAFDAEAYLPSPKPLWKAAFKNAAAQPKNRKEGWRCLYRECRAGRCNADQFLLGTGPGWV